MTAGARGRVRRAAAPVIGLMLVAFVVGFCLVYPLLPGYAPYQQDLSSALRPPLSSGHWLGTDTLGRDIASRLALAGRVTLSIVVGIIAVNAVVGTVIGIWAGYAGGRVDAALMAVADVQLALPILLVLIALAAARGPSVWLMVVVVACTYWVGYARVARAVAMSLRERDFIRSAVIQGAGTGWVLRRHLLPNLLGEILILASSDIGAMILLTSSFDFLGLGVQAPVPSWGLMIGEGQKYLRLHPELAFVPGAAIFLVVIGVMLASRRFTAEAQIGGARALRPLTPPVAGPPPGVHGPESVDAGLPLLIAGLTVSTTGPDGVRVPLVEDVTLRVGEQEVVCLVGESGSGKSVTMLAALGLLGPGLQVDGGRVLHRGTDLLRLPAGRLRALRGSSLAMVFQDPMTALNPVKRVGPQIARTFRLHAGADAATARARTVELLSRVGIAGGARRARAYPHEWSGGMRQRAVIAMAIANSPDVLIADEPTTALDVTVQAQVMDLLAEARRGTGAAMVLITHDLGLVAEVADRVAIMYAGRIVEEAPVAQIFAAPRHPYTRGLLDSLLTATGAGGRAVAIPGSPSAPGARPAGCAFAPRCTAPARQDPDRARRCAEVVPVLQVLQGPDDDTPVSVACHHADTAPVVVS